MGGKPSKGTPKDRRLSENKKAVRSVQRTGGTSKLKVNVRKAERSDK